MSLGHPKVEKSKEQKRKYNSDKLSKAHKLSFIAGLMITGNTALLGAAVRWFPEVIPVLPGSDNNASVPFTELVVIGLTLGCLVLIGATLLRINPANRKIWGAMIALFSAPSVLTGGGFVVGFIIGIIGGVKAYTLTNDQLLECHIG
jgi:hypothetical protein